MHNWQMKKKKYKKTKQKQSYLLSLIDLQMLNTQQCAFFCNNFCEVYLYTTFLPYLTRLFSLVWFVSHFNLNIFLTCFCFFFIFPGISSTLIPQTFLLYCLPCFKVDLCICILPCRCWRLTLAQMPPLSISLRWLPWCSAIIKPSTEILR